MNCICITYVRSRCGNGQLVTVMAFGFGLPAGKDYSASRSVTTPVVPCVPEHHRQPDRIRTIRIGRVASEVLRFHLMNQPVPYGSAALRHLVTEVPPPLVAELLGYSYQVT